MAKTLEDALKAKAQATIDGIRQEAADKAKAILAEARREAADIRQEKAAQHRRKAESEANRIRREAKQEAARREARAYDELTHALMARLRERIREDEDRYKTSFTTMLDEALQAAQQALREDAEPKVHVIERDIDLLDQPTDEPFEGLGGVIVTSDDGAIRFDNSLDSRLELARPRLRQLLRNAEL